MLARLSLRIKGDVGFRQASLFQGGLMELINPEYADFLHRQNMHPYSQYVYKDKEGNIWWIIQTLNKEAYENIIKNFDENIKEITLTCDGEKKIKIVEKKFKSVAVANLLEDFYHASSQNEFKLEFLTPTAFRQNKRYVILPDIRLMIQNLMFKFSASLDDLNMTDEDALEDIVSKTFVSKHNICSLTYPLEGQNIPGFVGKIILNCKGSETMARYLRLLLSFGEFSGMGVKTGMGMGAYRIGGQVNEKK